MTTTTSFEAQYAGECWECGGRIEPGDRIERVPAHDNAYRHVHCPDDADLTRTGPTPCPRCHLYHAGECF